MTFSSNATTHMRTNLRMAGLQVALLLLLLPLLSPNAAAQDTTQTDTLQVDTSQADGPEVDTTQTDPAQTDTSQADAQQADAQQADTTQAGMQQTSAQQVAAQDGRWSLERAQEWRANHDWVVGANFVPSTAINQIDMWQDFTFDPETIDRELGWAADAGFNTMRVYLHYLVWARDAEGYKERMDQYLEIADSHGIKTMFVIFDDVWGDDPTLGEQPAPVPGVHNSAWVESPGLDQRLDEALWPVYEAHVKDLIGAFADDDRVLMWDLYNEPGNGKNPPSSTLPLLKKVVQWAREVDPSQPLTVGLWNWSDGYSELNEYQLAVSDITTFHTYVPPEQTREIVAGLRERVGERPLLVTEYMARTRDNTFQNHLPYFHEQNIGAINWGLVSGETQTIYPWDYPVGSSDDYFGRWREAVREVYPWEDRTDIPEPEVWFHDVFRRDGTPYDAEEVALIQRLAGQEAGQGGAGGQEGTGAQGEAESQGDAQN